AAHTPEPDIGTGAALLPATDADAIAPVQWPKQFRIGRSLRTASRCARSRSRPDAAPIQTIFLKRSTRPESPFAVLLTGSRERMSAGVAFDASDASLPRSTDRCGQRRSTASSILVEFTR
ncbi:hypothetical protein C1631_023095, partial [Chryseobacterium phosphatilyticum]